jgi:uncharacterized protein YecT (DUF1311 family)
MEGFVFRVAVGVGLFVVVFVLGVAPAGAQPPEEPDPCGHAYGPDLNKCWAREVERTEDEMNRVYRTLRMRLPDRAAEGLEKAQKLWLEFREAHLQAQYGADNPRQIWGSDYLICLSISRASLNRARTRELRRLLEPDGETLCPL